MKRSDFNIIYTIIVFISLASFEHIIIGLFPPLFQYIANDLKINIANLGFISAANILVTALSSVYWGYLSGKFERKKLIMIGTLFWVISIFLTSKCQSYIQLFLFQILTGVGLGCMASIGFSVLTDYIPRQKRGLILSFWGMAQGLGGIVGAMMASLTSTKMSWRFPFTIVGYIGLFLMILFLFIKEPRRGQAEMDLTDVTENDQYPNHIIDIKQIKGLLLKSSNVYLYIQAFFINISIGSLIWIPTLYIYKIIQQGYSTATAVIASGYLYALFQIGGMTSAYFGHLGDRFQRKTLKGRAYFTAILVIMMMPLYTLFFLVPLKNLSLPHDNQAFLILISILKQLFINPWMLLVFILSLVASAIQSANTPNWLALLTDVNLPEHRGIAFSVANLFNSIGRTIGNVGVGILLGIISKRFNEPYGYILTLSILQVFVIPSAYCYIKMAPKNVSDILEVKEILKERIEQGENV